MFSSVSIADFEQINVSWVIDPFHTNNPLYRSSHPEGFYTKAILKNFARVTGKQLVSESLC